MEIAGFLVGGAMDPVLFIVSRECEEEKVGWR